MKLYMAPLEGLTIHTYRNAFAKYYGEADKLFTPFIAAEGSRRMKKREIKDILPENNRGLYIVPQIISNNGDNFVKFAGILGEYGYREINLNMGCPSGTVVSKGKGSGLLKDKAKLKEFLDRIFSGLPDMNVSVKTRIGISEPGEIEELMDIFNCFPIHEIIIHPRVREDYYNGKPHMDRFMYALKKSRNPLCYNGDINTPGEYDGLIEKCGEIPVMCGRGLVRNPSLFNMIRHGKNRMTDIGTLKNFHDEIYREYRDTMPGETVVIYKMKEIWHYMIDLFEENESYIRMLKKSHNLVSYKVFADRIFREGRLH